MRATKQGHRAACHSHAAASCSQLSKIQRIRGVCPAQCAKASTPERKFSFRSGLQVLEESNRLCCGRAKSQAGTGGCDALTDRRSGDCFARPARGAGTSGTNPFNAAAGGASHPRSSYMRSRVWRCARAHGSSVSRRQRARYWRKRWRDADGKCAVCERLADAPRSGAPATYTPEQICAVVAMTCEKPSESERPISQSNQREIADEAIRRGLVPKISQRSVGRFLKKGAPQAPSHPLLANSEA